MPKLFKRIGERVLGNDFWLFLTVIGLAAYGSLFFFEHSTLLQLAGRGVFFSLVYWPILLVAARRKPWSNTGYRWGWIAAFLLYPLAVTLAGLRLSTFLNLPLENTINHLADARIIPLLGLGLLLTELALQAHTYWRLHKHPLRALPRFSLDHAFLLIWIFAALAFGFMLDLTPETRQANAGMGRINFSWSIAGQALLYLAPFWGCYWLNRHLLVPGLLRQKGLIHYGLGVAAATLLIYPSFGWLMQALPFAEHIGVVDAGQPLLQRINGVMATGAMPVTIFALTLPFIVAVEWFQQNRDLAALEQARSTTELRLLKQQINPHFFFNTLNNLYALSITQDARTPEVILQLSELMRYVIYKGQEAAVPIHQDLNYLEDYIQLQQMRLHPPISLTFEVELDHPDRLIPPLLFVILVENAFKHGLEPAAKAGFLTVRARLHGDQLDFYCCNSTETNAPAKEGLGLENLKRRLELHFPGRYALQLEPDAEEFRATLNIRL